MLKTSFLLLRIVLINAMWYHICSSTKHYSNRSEYYMAFIKAQKIVYDDSGRIISGSASVVDAVYVHTGSSAHSKQQVREKLGKVLYLSENRKTGVFLSPTRGPTNILKRRRKRSRRKDLPAFYRSMTASEKNTKAEKRSSWFPRI